MAITVQSTTGAKAEFTEDVLNILAQWSPAVVGPTISDLQNELRRNYRATTTGAKFCWRLPPIVPFLHLLEHCGFTLVHETRPRRCTRVTV